MRRMLDNPQSRLTSVPADALHDMVLQAARKAAAALSEMAGRTIVVESAELGWVPLAEISQIGGDPERQVVAVYLGVEGAAPGHILLALSESMAHDLVDMLLGQPVGTTRELGDLEVSALAETGNVTGSFFLNALADNGHLVLPPTPPVVIHEMCGAILDTLASDLATMEIAQAMVIETDFCCDGQSVEVSFFMLPAPALLEAVSRGLQEEEVNHGGGSG